jgi:cytochrome c
MASAPASRMTGTLPMPDVRPFATALIAMLATAPAAYASPELARSKNCVACHHPERKMIGPSFKAVAERYGKDEAAIKSLSEKVVKGGGGVWGPTPMPPQPAVSP